jgi:hypothetical protein
MGTSGQRDPGRFKVGDPITADFLNMVVDALIQRITIPGGIVTRVGQAVVLDFGRRGGGGGGAGFIGLVTKRYGSFVTVSQVDGSVIDLAQKTPPVTIDYVWCQTDAHPWLPGSVEPADPPSDYVLCLPAPPGLTMVDPNADPEADGFPEDFTFPIGWVAVGTVPEADLNLFRGADPDCFFTPSAAGCTLLSVDEQAYPIAL